MNRSGYCEADYWGRDEALAYGRWRGAVRSTINGKKGQAFLKELLATLEAMPEKKLIAKELQNAEGQVCAIGSVMVSRGLDTQQFDIDDFTGIAEALGINQKIIQEIEWENDQDAIKSWAELKNIDPDELRHKEMCDFVRSLIK